MRMIQFNLNQLQQIWYGSEKCTVNDFKSKGHIEGANINRSLLALGNCINILADKNKKLNAFVPYRDSKLNYASRAKNIKQKVQKNIFEGQKRNDNDSFKFVLQQLKQDFDFVKQITTTPQSCAN
eukprot:TRINITY_DN32143_c0_g1_i1.p3 TRINITY_DN32143_c0_g1~~TRINITY_DN32143_c0_g1_i1.p3  ORF type:complete len:125 (+),score=18.05 TRINITY_DN32143_c0_g1_i1:151-525(+)